MYVQINAGRNIEGTPMGDNTWRNFRVSLVSALYWNTDVDRAAIEVHVGSGVWAGITEESAHVSAFSVGTLHADSLRGSLAALARTYGQDSIALIVGDSELISAN